MAFEHSTNLLEGKKTVASSLNLIDLD